MTENDERRLAAMVVWYAIQKFPFDDYGLDSAEMSKTEDWADALARKVVEALYVGR